MKNRIHAVSFKTSRTAKPIIAAELANIGVASPNLPGSAGQIHLTVPNKSSPSLLFGRAKVFSIQSTQK
jgi:hypothetical protein